MLPLKNLDDFWNKNKHIPILMNASLTHNNIYCWNSNNNTLDLTSTPNAQEARRQPFEFDFTITISVI